MNATGSCPKLLRWALPVLNRFPQKCVINQCSRCATSSNCVPHTLACKMSLKQVMCVCLAMVADSQPGILPKGSAGRSCWCIACHTNCLSLCITADRLDGSSYAAYCDIPYATGGLIVSGKHIHPTVATWLTIAEPEATLFGEVLHTLMKLCGQSLLRVASNPASKSAAWPRSSMSGLLFLPVGKKGRSCCCGCWCSGLPKWSTSCDTCSNVTRVGRFGCS